MRSVAFAFVASLVCGSPALAASVQVANGQVSVNSGAGFKVLSASMVVGAGASVMVSPGGRADIVYDNGCREVVRGGAISVVAANPPNCTPRAALGGSKCSLKDSDPACAAVEPEAVSHDHLILGAIVAGGAVAAAIAIHNDNDKPASP